MPKPCDGNSLGAWAVWPGRPATAALSGQDGRVGRVERVGDIIFVATAHPNKEWGIVPT